MTAANTLAVRPSQPAGLRSALSARPHPGPGQREGAQADEALATGLGWFSVGIGLMEVLAPGGVARMIGVEDREGNRAILRLMGLREIAGGLGIFSRPRPAGWLWARVAGDALDLALLGAAAHRSPHPERLAAAAAAMVGVAGLDVYSAARLSRRPSPDGQGPPFGPRTVRKAITINRPIDEVYRFWRDLENLPRFMAHLESVRVVGEGRSLWAARSPLGGTVEWEALTTEDRPNDLIAWRSVEGSEVDTAGSVRFARAPGDRGTEVHVELTYSPPGGPLGVIVAKLLGEAPDQQLQDDLRHFKQVMEVGEVVLSDGALEGARVAQRPAQPLPGPGR